MLKNYLSFFKLIIFGLILIILPANLFAETLSSSQTNTSTDTIQDYTINTGVTLTILNNYINIKIFIFYKLN